MPNWHTHNHGSSAPQQAQLTPHKPTIGRNGHAATQQGQCYPLSRINSKLKLDAPQQGHHNHIHDKTISRGIHIVPKRNPHTDHNTQTTTQISSNPNMGPTLLSIPTRATAAWQLQNRDAAIPTNQVPPPYRHTAPQRGPCPTETNTPHNTQRQLPTMESSYHLLRTPAHSTSQLPNRDNGHHTTQPSDHTAWQLPDRTPTP